MGKRAKRASPRDPAEEYMMYSLDMVGMKVICCSFGEVMQFAADCEWIFS